MRPLSEKARRQELAEFLRARRERLTPAAAGLGSGRRRRTPGLRREEVAELAGIGTAWYTRLEQARDIRPSEGALKQIARALRLDEAEKKYFLNLAREPEPTAGGDEVVPPVLPTVLAGFAEPAVVSNQRLDLLAYNEAANALYDCDYLLHRNFLRHLFTPMYRALMPNWEHLARQHVAMFRFKNVGHLANPRIKSLVDELQRESQEFRDWWAEQGVAESQCAHETLDHPFAGRLCFEHMHFLVADSPNLQIVLWACDGAQTRQGLDELVRQLRHGDRNSVHNLWTALGAMPPKPGTAKSIMSRP